MRYLKQQEIVETTAMTRLAYNELRKWTLPEDEDGSDKGFLCETAHHTNWVPEDVFLQTHRELIGLSYGEAVSCLEQGLPIQRAGWNGSDMFVFKQVPSSIPLSLVPNMTSLPQYVKDIFISRGIGPTYVNQMAIVKPNGTVDSWVASSSDTFAKDWRVFKL